MFFKTKDMQRKQRRRIIRQVSPGGAHDKATELGYGIGEKETMLNEQMVLEKHDFAVVEAERRQNSKHWVLSMNVEGAQLPAASIGCRRLQDERMEETKQSTNQFSRADECVRIGISNSTEVKIIHGYVVGQKTGWKWHKEQQGNLPHASSSSSSSWKDSSWQSGIHGGGRPQSEMKGSE